MTFFAKQPQNDGFPMNWIWRARRPRETARTSRARELPCRTPPKVERSRCPRKPSVHPTQQQRPNNISGFASHLAAPDCLARSCWQLAEWNRFTTRSLPDCLHRFQQILLISSSRIWCAEGDSPRRRPSSGSDTGFNQLSRRLR